MKNIHVDDAQEQIIRTALAQYAASIRAEARGYRGGYSARAIDLNVLRLNVEAVLDVIAHTAPEPKATVVSIDSIREAAESLAA